MLNPFPCWTGQRLAYTSYGLPTSRKNLPNFGLVTIIATPDSGDRVRQACLVLPQWVKNVAAYKLSATQA